MGDLFYIYSFKNILQKMKKILFFSALMLIFTSCSSDEESSSENLDSTLPKTISFIYPNENLGTNSIGTLTYDGNKIVSLTREQSKIVFTYDGNTIKKQEVFDLDFQKNETKSKEVLYAYENGKLKTRILKVGFADNGSEALSTIKTVYTYTSDVLVNYNYYSVSTSGQEKKEGEGSLELKDGNIIKDSKTSGASKITTTYEFDSKNNPLKNILGFNLLLNEVDGFGKNNIVKTSRVSTEFPNPAVYLTSYTYNDKGYPIKRTAFDSSGISIEYETEYTY